MDDLTEFYDLTRDPFQMENAVNDPQYRDVIAKLKQYLDAERPSGALSLERLLFSLDFGVPRT